MVSDPGVAEVVDGTVVDAGELEVAVYRGTNVADEQGPAVFGDEDMVGFSVFGPDLEPFLYGVSGGFIEGDVAARL